MAYNHRSKKGDNKGTKRLYEKSFRSRTKQKDRLGLYDEVVIPAKFRNAFDDYWYW
jgi:hypothetical protein